MSTTNTRVKQIKPLIPPGILLEELPLSQELSAWIVKQRQTVSNIIHGTDDRLLVIVGPCSIHCTKAALEYAEKLKVIADQLADDIFVVMRVYFEKPRTTVGWKGLINDPHLDGSFAINQGLHTARKLLLSVNQMGLPVGCELLDTISPQFIADTITWGAIGARTTESQLHRELTSGLSFPVGFKNGTSGDVQIAVDAMIASRAAHCFLGVTDQGLAGIVHTMGNKDTHVILRGAQDGPNYSATHVHAAVAAMEKSNVECVSVIIDSSHGNSRKDHRLQTTVLDHVGKEISGEDDETNKLDALKSGRYLSDCIHGVMTESFLVAGKQTLILGQAHKLTYGQSITDGCIDMEATEKCLRNLAVAVQKRRQRRLKRSNFASASQAKPQSSSTSLPASKL